MTNVQGQPTCPLNKPSEEVPWAQQHRRLTYKAQPTYQFNRPSAKAPWAIGSNNATINAPSTPSIPHHGGHAETCANVLGECVCMRSWSRGGISMLQHTPTSLPPQTVHQAYRNIVDFACPETWCTPIKADHTTFLKHASL